MSRLKKERLSQPIFADLAGPKVKKERAGFGLVFKKSRRSGPPFGRNWDLRAWWKPRAISRAWRILASVVDKQTRVGSKPFHNVLCATCYSFIYLAHAFVLLCFFFFFYGGGEWGEEGRGGGRGREERRGEREQKTGLTGRGDFFLFEN